MTVRDLPTSLADLVAERLGLSAFKPFQNALPPALEKLAVAMGTEPDRLADSLSAKPLSSDEWQSLIGALTVGETRFLRQRAWFEQIERTVLSPLVTSRRLRDRRQLRIWCAGCSTGEEPYTVAMILRRLIADPSHWSISILASDIRRNALATAIGGEYPISQFRELDEGLIARFCKAAGARRYSVAPELLQWIRFEFGNLADIEVGSPHYDGGPYDLIICRNVLMYMVPAMQRRVAARLRDALSVEGWIAVSAAEAVAEWFQPLDPVNAGEAILFRNKQPAPQRAVLLQGSNIIEAPFRGQQPVVPPARPRKLEAERPPASPDLDGIQRLADAGRLDEAAELCRAVVRKDNMNAGAAILLAAILIELGEYDAALESARRAVYLEPASVTAMNLMAGALLNLGHAERAKRAFVAAERLAGDLAAAAADHQVDINRIVGD
jgi:chemotaxis protein methyltransferase CheR